MGEPARQGYLIKQGRVVRNWMKRWFVLRDDRLFYYKNPSDTQEVGMLQLTPDCRVLDGAQKTGKKHCLEIRMPERDFFLYSDISAEDIEGWRDALLAACQISRSGALPSRAHSTELYVRGMMGDCCVDNVRAAVERLRGYQSVQIDLEEERVLVVGKVDVSSLYAALEEAGYMPAPVQSAPLTDRLAG